MSVASSFGGESLSVGGQGKGHLKYGPGKQGETASAE
jgi:hypothetical protein